MCRLDPKYTDFDKTIDQVSKTWMPDIIEFLEAQYQNKWMPSHDISHHRRVWHNAIELSHTILSDRSSVRPSFFDELIICCFFHDTGLIVDPGEFHGQESKRFTIRFLKSCGQKVNFDTTPLLDAIEKHDDKNYQTENYNTNLLFEILSLADDIDALGAIGLYRYIEIYLVRGLEAEKIPELILSNVRKRYDHLAAKLEKHKIETFPFTQKYHVLVNLLDANAFSDSPVSLVKWIDENIVSTKKLPVHLNISNDFQVEQNRRLATFIDKFLL